MIPQRAVEKLKKWAKGVCLVVAIGVLLSGLTYLIYRQNHITKIQVLDVYELESESSKRLIIIKDNLDKAYDVESSEVVYLVHPFTLKSTSKKFELRVYIMDSGNLDSSLRDFKGKLVP